MAQLPPEKWTQFRFVTYNILSANFCNSSVYREYPPEMDNREFRLEIIKKRLLNYIHYSSFICLQEVDIWTSCELHLFFRAQKYEFIYEPYGGFWSGHMGVAIAVPQWTKIMKIDKFRLMDGKKWGSFPPEEEQSNVSEEHKVYVEAYNKMKLRENHRFLSVKIQYGPDNKCFWLSKKTSLPACVHVPCEYEWDTNMVTYYGIIYQHISALAKDDPFVLVGDFNAEATSETYFVISTGDLSKMKKRLAASVPPEDDWHESLQLQPMTSALWKFFGKEANFTTKCFAHDHEKPYIGTLDYIWISDANMIKVRDCVKLPSTPESISFCPNLEEPSDHLAVWAELEFP